ncbi:anti-sigma factor antagonist [Actinomadura logoneensis]|uniref:Anti-sigma factor antagonist n=1 Tax=Actinomadura logoneensis TaxID=2293572 RepID=A0A372JLK9_9ACTN|nr:STAS domain-containing protein [Actinomadura logoneensis]RFU40912.1 anti-sigma factor antagonist [Actinomadura logoneensis]
MTDRTLTAVADPHPSGATVLAVSGELDHHTAPELSEVIHDLTFDATTPVIIDLTDLVYCDSTGITVLVTTYKRAQASRTPLILVGLNADLTRVFGIVGLDRFFTFRPTVEEAVEALRSPVE